jgi:hypothetical protein
MVPPFCRLALTASPVNQCLLRVFHATLAERIGAIFGRVTITTSAGRCIPFRRERCQSLRHGRPSYDPPWSQRVTVTKAALWVGVGVRSARNTRPPATQGACMYIGLGTLLLIIVIVLLLRRA